MFSIDIEERWCQCVMTGKNGTLPYFYTHWIGDGVQNSMPKNFKCPPSVIIAIGERFQNIETPPPHFPLLLERGSNDYSRKILNRPHILHSHLREGSKYHSCNISTLLPPFSDFLFYYWRGVITYYGHTMLNTPSYF